MTARRAGILVLDGVGIGAASDAAAYGDVGSNTLGNVARAVGGLSLPNLQRLGLGMSSPLAGMPPAAHPTGAFGLMEPASAGKDSTTGHWEIAGVRLAVPFPTYPNGFPRDVLDEFAARTGREVICNEVASGTDVLERWGEQHVRTGAWIVYTSADSVFQVAAHESVVPLAELYAGCEAARKVLVAPNNASRVIARPFTGGPGAWHRTTNRRDFSVAPTGPRPWSTRWRRPESPERGVGKVRRPVCAAGDRGRPHDRKCRGNQPNSRLDSLRKWVPVRQPCRFRPIVWAPERCSGVL